MGQTLTTSQLEAYWTQAGGDPAQAGNAAAVAQAESGGRTSAINPDDPMGSFGPWQINQFYYPGAAGTGDPSFYAPFQGVTPNTTSADSTSPSGGYSSPSENATAAVGVWSGAGGGTKGWGRWTDPAAEAIAAGQQSYPSTVPTPTPPPGSVAPQYQPQSGSAPQRAPYGLQPIVDWASRLWQSTIFFAIGLALVLVGAIWLATDHKVTIDPETLEGLKGRAPEAAAAAA